MDRRTACAALGALAGAPMSAFAQPKRVLRVAYLSLDTPADATGALVNFRRGMRDRGWAEGRNLAIDLHWGHGSVERAIALVPAIVASRPDVVVAISGQVVRPLKDTGIALPVVFTTSGDAEAAGLVASYARPGGNFTGISFFQAELVAKRIEILRELLPQVRRVAFIGWARHAGEPLEVNVSMAAARRAGVESSYHPTGSGADIDAAFDAAAKLGAHAVLVFADGVTLANAARLAEHSRRHRIPFVSGWATYALQGALFSYGPNREASYAYVASFVDRIARGTKPGDIPVWRPDVHEFVANVQTARELGITMPPTVLARATLMVG